MHPGEMQSELMNNIDKSLAWLLAPSSFFRYLNSVLTKRRQGQPVSFTDFFGHMVGETLLKGVSSTGTLCMVHCHGCVCWGRDAAQGGEFNRHSVHGALSWVCVLGARRCSRG